VACIGFCEGDGPSPEGARFEAPEAPWDLMWGTVSPPTQGGVWAECCVPPRFFLIFGSKWAIFVQVVLHSGKGGALFKSIDLAHFDSVGRPNIWLGHLHGGLRKQNFRWA